MLRCGMRFFLALMVSAAPFLVNTEAGTFRCVGRVVGVDALGVPSSVVAEGIAAVRCVRLVAVRDTV